MDHEETDDSWTLRNEGRCQPGPQHENCAKIFEKPFTPYFVSVESGPTFFVIREMPEDEYSLFKCNCSVIVTQSRDMQLYLGAWMNYRDYLKASDDYEGQFVSRHDQIPSPTGGEIMILNINRCLLNVMSSIRTFLDHTATNINRRHGPDSARLRDFKEATAALFDNSFTYRFMSKLRNYVQHCGMPIGKLTLNERMEDNDLNQVKRTLEFQFSRDSLLTNFNSWGGRLKSDLEKLPEHFPIKPYVVEMMSHIEKLQNMQTHAEMPNVCASIQWLDHLHHEGSFRGGEPNVCVMTPVAGIKGDWSVRIEHFPLELMEAWKKSYEKVLTRRV